MMKIRKPDGARWFGIEHQAPGSDAWLRLDDPDLGKWWRPEAVHPEEVLSQTLEPGTKVRILWAPDDRRAYIGRSIQFAYDPAGLELEDGPQAMTPPQPTAPPPAHLAPPPATPTPAPPPPAAEPPQPQPPPVVTASPAPALPSAPLAPRARSVPQSTAAAPQIPPSFPLPFTPPEGDPGPLTTVVYLHGLLRQDYMAQQQLMYQTQQMMMETERRRADAMIESMRLHFTMQMDYANRREDAERAAARHEGDRMADLVQSVKQLAESMDLQDEEVAQAMQAAQLASQQQPGMAPPNIMQQLLAFGTTEVGQLMLGSLLKQVGMAQPMVPPQQVPAE